MVIAPAVMTSRPSAPSLVRSAAAPTATGLVAMPIDRRTVTGLVAMPIDLQMLSALALTMVSGRQKVVAPSGTVIVPTASGLEPAATGPLGTGMSQG